MARNDLQGIIQTGSLVEPRIFTGLCSVFIKMGTICRLKAEISGLECGPVDSLPALFTGIFAVIAAGIANAFGRWWEAWLKGLGLIAFTVDFWIHKSLPRWLLVYCLQSMLIWTSILDVESGRRTPDTPKFFLAILPPWDLGQGFRKHRCLAQQVGGKQSLCAWTGWQRIPLCAVPKRQSLNLLTVAAVGSQMVMAVQVRIPSWGCWSGTGSVTSKG